MTTRLREDDRGVSIAVTHVLTIGITTVLISGLLIAGGTMLDAEKERGAGDALETIGERLGSEIAAFDRANGTDGDALRVEHPRRVSGSTYSVELTGICDEAPLIDDGVGACLRLWTHDLNVEVYVPLPDAVGVDDGSSTGGGPIEIVRDGDGNIRLGGDSR